MLREETIDRALNEVAKGYAQYQYFFDHLKSPAWLEPLSRFGFFQKPPEPQREGQYISFQLWPESRYLARMASTPEAQDVVLAIALRIPRTENSRVYDDLADVALALTPERSAKLVPQACEWIESPNKLLLPEKIGKLIVRLAEGGQGAAALTLARAALALGPDPRLGSDAEQEFLIPQPRARFQDFYYERIVGSAVPALVEATGLAAVELFCDILADFIKLSHRDTDKDHEDDLHSVQPTIEGFKNPHDLASTITCAVRDACEGLTTSDANQFRPVVALLRKWSWTTFRRLELHLCRVFPDQGQQFAEEFFQNPAELERRGLQHEAVLLLKTFFTTLRPETQERILGWIDAGPPEEGIRWWLELSQQPVTDEGIRSIADQWRRDNLAPLQGQLPKAYEEKLAKLKIELGEGRRLEEPEKVTFGAFGPKSPKSPEELSQMSVDQIVTYVLSWAPNPDMFSSTPEGLGRNITAIVTQRPTDFASVALRFRELDPTYVRSLITGLADATKQDRPFDWKHVLELAEWVTGQPREIAGRKGKMFVTDPDWGWTRDAIIDLLRTGFESKGGKLPYESRELVWRVLFALTKDPNPSPEDESGPHFDPASLAINSTRGRAFDAVIRYAWWVRECTEETRKAEGKTLATFNEFPEVRDVLDIHLDIAKEPTLTIRSVYGQSLPSVAVFGLDWLRENLDRIFPQDDRLFAAVWESFVVFARPNLTLMPILLPAYQRAVRRIGQQALLRQPISPDVRLAQHLMVYYWLGKLDFGGEDRLVDDFYAAASDDLRAHAMWFIGSSVRKWDDKVPAEAYERLRALIERRLDAARRAPSPGEFFKELSNFGFWFASGKFDQRWALNTLLSVLQVTRVSDAEMDVVKRLADICPQFPLECVSCLRLMIEGDRQRWMLIGVESDVRRLLRSALDSNQPEASHGARRLIEELIARGHFEFRGLVT